MEGPCVIKVSEVHSRFSEILTRGQARGSAKSCRSGKPVRSDGLVPNSVGTRIQVLSGRIIQNFYVIAFTSVLTIWVLVCDDFRILLTDKPADDAFGTILVICIIIFTIELVLSCIGRKDYLGGFFFKLDVLSTASLIIDLPWVQDALVQDTDTSIDSAAQGRTARIGAKVARVVRVIRLVRVAKLYKTALATIERRVDRYIGLRQPGDDDEEWDRMMEESGPKDADAALKETRVGKKLAEITTQRVIILILAMLIALPFLSAPEGRMYPSSAYYGADVVWHTFRDTRGSADSRTVYEKAMLKYVYYHNWFAALNGCPESKFSSMCPNLYYSHVYWIGISGPDSPVRDAAVRDARLHAQTVEEWNVNASRQNDLYNFGEVPVAARTALSSPWSVACHTRHRSMIGVSLLVEDAGVDFPVECPSDLRPQESDVFFPGLVTPEEFSDYHFIFYFDLRPFLRADALMGLAVTAFVCALLCIANAVFAHDANRLVLKPVESMIAKINTIRANPLLAVEMVNADFKKEEKDRLRKTKTNTRFRAEQFSYIRRIIGCIFRCGSRSTVDEPMETLILEKTIMKLGTLLVLGFGQAGTCIINQNMLESEQSSVNPMVEGTLVDCIIGYARIQDFSTATEVLQKRLMTFVNQVAEIVHGVIDEFHGAPNRNTGDTFLIVWRLTGKSPEIVQMLADSSVVAFCKILGALHESPMIATYREHPAFQQRLGSRYRVCMNVGLHAGWAIEGAVGSEFKIDASYISPNVAIAASIESATRQYRVCFLVTQAVADMCTRDCAAKLRLIDRVLITGSKHPLDLYSMDLDVYRLTPETSDEVPTWNARQRFKVRQFMEAEKKKKLQLWYDSPLSYFSEDATICKMRCRFSTQFQQVFMMGYQNYAQGQWEVAKNLLSRTRRMLTSEDGPSAALLQFMRTTDFQAPPGWPGHRAFNVAASEDSSSSTHALAQGTASSTAANEVEMAEKTTLPDASFNGRASLHRVTLGRAPTGTSKAPADPLRSPLLEALELADPSKDTSRSHEAQAGAKGKKKKHRSERSSSHVAPQKNRSPQA